MMKKITIATLITIFFLGSLSVIAQAQNQNRFRNKVRKDRDKKEFMAIIDEIPIYRHKLEGKYTILGHVHSQDVLTSSKDRIYNELRIKTYKAGGNAIMEFRCEKVGKSLIVTCEGFAVKVDS